MDESGGDAHPRVAVIMEEGLRNPVPALSKEQSLLLTELQGLEADFVALCNRVGKSRELSLAVTNMEQASMWAVRHVIGSAG